MAILDVKHINKTYDAGHKAILAINDVSLEVETGEFIAVLGPSGSGKSTLLHLLGGLERATSGDIFLGTVSYNSLNDEEMIQFRGQNIGFLYHFSNLFPALTVEENIRLPFILTNRSAELDESRLNDFLDITGMTEFRDVLPDRLTFNQQQRVAIARAFMINPMIVLADEPTFLLDPYNGTAILTLLQNICFNYEIPLILATHDLNAASYANRIILLMDGQVVQMIKRVPGPIENSSILYITRDCA